MGHDIASPPLQVVFTLDYEIHGNGEGRPHALMVEPTDALLRLFDAYGARLTVMADVAEILKFGEYKQASGCDLYGYDAIVEQLRRTVSTGHDVQLHLHSSYFNAREAQGRWQQDWAEYDFAALPYERMHWMVGTGKRFLEATLRDVDPAYRCIAFRAANWSVSPSANVVDALANNGIELDCSVFKHGRRDGLVRFDYTAAHSHLAPWRAARDDICREDAAGRLWELPIYAEPRWIGAFASAGRVHRALAGREHRLDGSASEAGPSAPRPGAAGRGARRLRALWQRHAWKADFNQCDARQLIRALERAHAASRERAAGPLPFVLIGHSKLVTAANERRLAKLLAHVDRHPQRYRHATLSQAFRACCAEPATAPHGHLD